MHQRHSEGTSYGASTFVVGSGDTAHQENPWPDNGYMAGSRSSSYDSLIWCADDVPTSEEYTAQYPKQRGNCSINEDPPGWNLGAKVEIKSELGYSLHEKETERIYENAEKKEATAQLEEKEDVRTKTEKKKEARAKGEPSPIGVIIRRRRATLTE